MGRGSSVVILAGALSLTAGLVGCGSTRRSAGPTTPASITLSPSSASLDLGQTQQFTATAQDATKKPITVTVTYSSSNTAALTISNGGLACAGSWDSLSNPITCTPGPAAVATVTASSAGVVSPPVTVYVHQHIDNISITPVNPPSGANCNPHVNAIGISQNQNVIYQAAAFSQGVDITPTVGPFTWTQENSAVVKLNPGASGLLNNQVQATASTPGTTQISASAASVMSTAVDFQTCPVQSITLTVSGGSENAIAINKGSSASITATVVDTLGQALSSVPLTWCSSEPAAVSSGSTNCGSLTTNPMSVSGALVGGGDVTASCTPPSCNAEILDSAPNGTFHSVPIYPDQAIAITVNPTSQTSGQTTSAYVATTQCGNNFGCTSSIVAIAVPGNNVGSSTTLPNTPNSLVFDRQGKNAFLGSQNGLMLFAPANAGSSSGAVTVYNNVTGKVLAVSPSGNKAIVSDTVAIPNRVSVFDVTNTGSPVNLLITRATAAAFSPDSLKGYIVAGNTLYVYSGVDALQTLTLSVPATDVTFLPAGSLAYVAGGSGSAGSVIPVTTCKNELNPSVASSAPPVSIQPVLDGTHLLMLTPSGIDVISTSITSGGCSPTFSTSVPQFVNLGQGQFTPVKLLVSSDGKKAYILASNRGAVMVYDIAAGTSSALPLTGNVTAVTGDITLDGSLLYVAASDGNVHAVNTVSGGDIQTISFPANFTFCNNVSFTCEPDLVAVQP